MSKKVRFLVEAAVIAALYAAVTLALSPFSYGPFQLRVSESLTILPAFTPAAIPGLFIGCLIANVFSPIGAVDLILGSLTTLVAAYFSYKLRKNIWLVPIPQVLGNGIVIGMMLKYLYGWEVPLYASIGWVALSEFASCYIIGIPLYKGIKKYTKFFQSEGGLK